MSRTDPIDQFFSTQRSLAPVEPPAAPEPAPTPTSAPAQGIESLEIAKDARLVRTKLSEAITLTSAKIPALLDIASQMQDPDMVEALAKLLTSFAKMNTDLVSVDLKLLEAARGTDKTPIVAEDGEPKEEGVAMTTASVMSILSANRKKREANG